tara:strand:+ start:1102 stop:2481 length:1380 start_codon:yes stop_codon:yes gene_type:complete
MAKVKKSNRKVKGIIYVYWSVDARSLGKGEIFKNPYTNKPFESKKEAQAYLDELNAKISTGVNLDSDKLEVIKLCAPGEYETLENSNSGEKQLIDGKDKDGKIIMPVGEYIAKRFTHLEDEEIGLNHFQSIRWSLGVLIEYCNNNNIKYWTAINAESFLRKVLKDCKANANDKESVDLRDASAWTTFEKHIKNLKCMSSWIALEKNCDDIFANIITSKKHGRDVTFKKPKRLEHLQRQAKDKTVNVDMVEMLRQKIVDKYQEKNKNYKPEWAESRRRTMLLQFDLIKAIGLRIGEALALTWDDIIGNEIRINKQYNSKSNSVTDTKGGVFEHFVYVSDTMANRLQEHKELQLDEERENDLVFPNTRGEHDSRRVLGRIMKQYSKDLWSNPSMHISPHTLRHLFATEMIRKGGKDALPMVSDILRHSTGVKFTEKQYVHETKKSDKQIVKQIEAVTGLYN